MWELAWFLCDMPLTYNLVLPVMAHRVSFICGWQSLVYLEELAGSLKVPLNCRSRLDPSDRPDGTMRPFR